MGCAVSSAVSHVGSAANRKISDAWDGLNAMSSPTVKIKNLRTALVLAVLAAAVFFGFIAQSWYLNH